MKKAIYLLIMFVLTFLLGCNSTSNKIILLEDEDLFQQEYRDWKSINAQIIETTEIRASKTRYLGRKEIENLDDKTKEEILNINSDLIRLRDLREAIELRYNARARMKEKKFFKDSDLPYQLLWGNEARQ